MTELEDRRLGAATILFGAGGGKYPDNNALLIEGAESTMLVDPSLGVRVRGRSALPPVDLVLDLLELSFDPLGFISSFHGLSSPIGRPSDKSLI